jgi:acetyl esterase
MKRKTVQIILLFLFIQFSSFQYMQAQNSCHSGEVDPRVAFLLQMPDFSLEQIRAMPIEEIRKMSPPDLQPIPESKMQRIQITADNIPVIIYKPDNISNKILPVIINYHGGAFVTGMQPWMYHIGYDMANTFEAIVFDVDYPVAPEHRFPMPVMSAYSAFKWIAENAMSFGGDTSKIILSGGSAGANLAAVIAIKARDEGLGEKIKLVSLFCPIVDNPINSSYPSYQKNGKGHLLTEAFVIWALENYTGTDSPDSSDYRLFPIRAKSFRGLPPTIVFTAEFDILHDEGEAYANKLREAGVPVFYKCFHGQLHTLAGLPPEADEWNQMNNDTKAFMKKYL